MQSELQFDIPSGLFADSPSSGEIVNAHHTVTFQLPKLAFLFPENHKWVGRWHLVDIGLSKEFVKSASTSNYFVTEKSIKKIIKPRDQFSHKGTYGHALLIAGSYGKMGASVLAAQSCFAFGVGITHRSCSCLRLFYNSTSVPEAMASTDGSENYFSSLPEI